MLHGYDAGPAWKYSTTRPSGRRIVALRPSVTVRGAGQARGAALLEPRQEFVEGIDVEDPLDMAHGRQAIFAGT